MADVRRRRCERAARLGDLDAEGRLLLERVRAGELERERLELAAHLGHRPARRALGLPPLRQAEPLAELVSLARFGRPVLVRILVVAARRLGWAPSPVGDEQLRAAAAWCDCPCPRHASSAYQASRSLPEGTQPSFPYYAAMAAHYAGNMEGPAGGRSLESLAKIALRELAAACGGAARLRTLVQGELIAWAVEEPSGKDGSSPRVAAERAPSP